MCCLRNVKGYFQSNKKKMESTLTIPSTNTHDNHHGASNKQNGVHKHDARREISKTVVLLGSGDMTMGLAINLLRAKLRPVIASRNPERARSRLKNMMNLDVEVATVQEGLSMGDIIIVAIPSDHHNSLPRELLKNKILIDISNRSPSASSGGPSLAEKLQDMFPDSHVVKAFNTLSAYALSHGIVQGCKEVPVCGDTEWARSRISSIVRDLGFIPVDKGVLGNSRAVEDIPLSFFPDWKIPSIMSLCFFIIYWIMLFLRIEICPNIESNEEWDWSRFNYLPLFNSQICLAFTAATLLLSTYIPGTFAAYIQLYRGTKYSQFPSWLDKWLKCRKQLGLLALLLGTTHGCAALFSSMSDTHTGEWHQELYFMAGPILAALLGILGVTSLPSVSAQLTWREFSFVQRYLGWSSVLVLFIHGGFANWGRLLLKPSCVVVILPAQIFFVLCVITISLKIPLVMPCVDSYLVKIRNGYERTPPKISPA